MKNYIIITIDYETWHPSSKKEIKVMRKCGLKINWEKDIIEPTYKLLDSADLVGAKLTLMVEMGEYIWLKKNGRADIVYQIENQLQNAILRGHDVQLHLHPHWLPETGADINEMDMWEGDINYATADSYPFDLAYALQQCKSELEKIIRQVKPDYKVLCYRAGGYRIQPFERLYNALVSNKIYYDTSVYYKGKAKDRGYNFSKCIHQIQPYFAGRINPAVEDVSAIMEIPIYANKYGKRWMLDGKLGNELANWYYTCDDIEKLNENYYIMVGHSKESHDYQKIEQQLKILALGNTNQWMTLSGVAKQLSEKSTSSKLDTVVDSVELIYGEEKKKNFFDIILNDNTINEKVLQKMWVDFVWLDMRKSGFKVEIIRFLRDDSRFLRFTNDGVWNIFEPLNDRLIIYKRDEDFRKVMIKQFHQRGMYIIENEAQMLKLSPNGVKRKVLDIINSLGKSIYNFLRIKNL